MRGKRIAILFSDRKECAELCTLLSLEDSEVIQLYSLEDLMSTLQKSNVMVILIDLDSQGVENRTIRDIALSHPSIPILGLSKDAFHPELKDAISCHLYACLTKPVDPEELIYWINCIHDETGNN